MSNGVLGLLGLARRAGLLTFGLDATLERVSEGRAFLLLCAADASPRTRRELTRRSDETGVPLRLLPFDMETLGRSIGRSATACVAVLDEKLAEKAAALCAEPST